MIEFEVSDSVKSQLDLLRQQYCVETYDGVIKILIQKIKEEK